MRFLAVVDRPVFEANDGVYYFLVLERQRFLALSRDLSLANWIAGADPNIRTVVKVTVDNGEES